MIYIIQGDIFGAPHSYSFGQCISKDTRWGMFKGIAVDFLKYFPSLRVLRERVVTLGTAEPVIVGERVIYNLISKPTYWSKPTLSCLRDCIISMHMHACDNEVKDVAIPLIGAGLDGLDFNGEVFPILKEVFGSSLVCLHIYHQGQLGCNRFVPIF